MSDDEAVWDSSFAESVRTVGSDFGDSFSILAGEEVNAASFVAPEPPAGFSCPRCGKRYKTKRGFDSHVKMHNLRDASCHRLSTEQLRAHSQAVAEKVLIAMSKRNANGPPGQAIQECCVHLLLLQETEEWVIFVEDVSEHIINDCLPQQFSSPSALYGEFTKKLQDLLSNAVFRTSLSNKFCAFGLPMEPDTKILLMVGFVRQFAKEIFELLIKSMRQPEVGSSSSAQQPLTLKKKQIYHYVAGSVVKSLLRKGLLHKAKNLKWRKVVSCIETCFKESGYNVSPAEPEARQWTELVNRGGLTNVGQQTLEFFYLCGSIAESVKPPSRYSFFQEVFQSTQLAYLWEEIVSGSVLTPEESTWLMELMCRLFFNTFCKGYCNKARNDHLGKGQSSVSTRKRLAR